MFFTKRVYESPEAKDGKRFLVDRLWPRGLSKEAAQLDDWIKDIAPSDALRKWFDHDPEKWNEFRKRYFRELKEKSDSLKPLLEAARGKDVTLLFGAKDCDHNNAIALKEFLSGKSTNRKPKRITARANAPGSNKSALKKSR